MNINTCVSAAWQPCAMDSGKFADRTSSGPVAELSARELEILSLFAQGESAKRIALLLRLSHRTVETHSASIIVKLGARNRINAVAIAVYAGLVKPAGMLAQPFPDLDC